MNKFVDEIGIGVEWLELRQRAQAVIQSFDVETGEREWNASIDDVHKALNDLETAVAATDHAVAFYPFDLLAELARHARRVLDAHEGITYIDNSEAETAIANLRETMTTVDREMMNGIFHWDNFPAVIERDQFDSMEKSWNRDLERFRAMRAENVILRDLLQEWRDEIRGMVANVPEYLQFNDRVEDVIGRPFMRMLTAEEWASVDRGEWWHTSGDPTAVQNSKIWSVDRESWERAKNAGMAARKDRWRGLYLVANV